MTSPFSSDYSPTIQSNTPQILMQKGRSSFCRFAHTKHSYWDWKLPNGVHTPQRLRKILLQFSCKKYLPDSALYAEVDYGHIQDSCTWTSQVGKWPPPGSRPPHWAASAIRASAGASALQHVVQHRFACRRSEGAWSSCCSFTTKVNKARHVMSHGAIAEMIMTSQRVSRNCLKTQRTDEFLRGSFPDNDPCHKKRGNEYPFPERGGIAYPEIIFSGVSTL